MNILLDTHILLWTLSNDMKLPKKARKIIENEENEIYYSIVSLWEVQIKFLAHPDIMPISAAELVKYCEQSGFQRVSIKAEHVFALNRLKREKDVPRHKDPFDRMLVCQASAENMIFVTHDHLIAGYIDPCIMVV